MFDQSTHLFCSFPRREDVDRSNKERLDRLRGDSYTYNALDGGLADERTRNNVLNNFMAPKSLLLKVEAQVWLLILY
jgi:ATP-dependent DNA helicase PIF1